MAEFKSYAQPAGFQPIQLPDIAGQLADRDRKLLEDFKQAAQFDITSKQRNLRAVMAAQEIEAQNRDKIFELDQNNRDRVQQATLENYNQQIKNAENKGRSQVETLKALGTFSGKAVEAYTEAISAYDEARTLAVHKTIYDTGISLKQMLELQKLGDNMTSQTLRESEALQQMSQDTGVSINQLLYLAQNSNSKYWNEATAFSQQIGYGWQQALQSNLTTPFDYNGKETTLIQAREYGNVDAERYGYNLFLDRYRKDSGMLNMSVQAIEKNVNPILRSVEAQYFTAANAKAREVIANDAANAETLALTQVAFSQGGAGILSSINEAPNRGVQQDKWFKLLTTWASSADPGMRERAQDIVTQMAGTTIDYNGKQMLYGDLQRGNEAWLNILDSLEKGRARDVQRYNLEQTERSIEAVTSVNRILQAAEDQGLPVSEADLDNLVAKLEDTYGRDGQSVPAAAIAIIDEYRKNSTIEASTARTINKRLTDLADRGVLTLERIKALGIPLHRVPGDLIAVARATSADHKANNNFKTQFDLIESMVKSPPQIQAKSQGQWHWSVGAMAHKLQNQFLTKYAQLQAGNDPNAAQNAFIYVQQEFAKLTKNTAAFTKESGYAEFKDQKISSSGAAAAARMQRINGNIGKLGAKSLDTNGAIFTISQLKEIEADMRKPGFKMDPTAQYVGRLFGVDPITVVNRQRIAAGMSPVELPEAKIKFDREADPRFLRLLQQFPTPDTSRRAMISTGTFNAGLIPKGYGPLVVAAAQKAGISPIYVAALAEAENKGWDTNLFSGGGYSWDGVNAGVGLMQLNQQYHGRGATVQAREQALKDPAHNLELGAGILTGIQKKYSNWKDAVYVWNMGEAGFKNWVASGRPATQQARYANDLYERFEKARARYGDKEALRSPGTMRPSMRRAVYKSGNIGPTSTGDHLDVKMVGGGRFNPNDLDEYVVVKDRELGEVPLGRVPITNTYDQHVARGSHGIDYGLYSGTEIFLRNGAKVVSSTPTEHGDKLIIQLPDGRKFSFLHGMTN